MGGGKYFFLNEGTYLQNFVVYDFRSSCIISNNLSVTLDCNSNKFKINGKFAIVLNITSPESPRKITFYR